MTTEDNNIRIQSAKDPAQLEREIDQQRDHIAELVDALGSKLSPGEMFERALSYSKGGGQEFVGNLTRTIRENPVPAVLTAAGMVWLFAGTRSDSVGTTTTARTTVGTTTTAGHDKPHLGERVQHLREGASEKMHGASRAAHNAADSARSGAHRASEGFQHMLQDNPMALGAMGVVAGALLGAMLPVTRKEHELMGHTSDKLTDRAREKTRSGLDAASDVGREVKAGARSGGDGGTEQTSRPAGQTSQANRQPPQGA